MGASTPQPAYDCSSGLRCSGSPASPEITGTWMAKPVIDGEKFSFLARYPMTVAKLPPAELPPTIKPAVVGSAPSVAAFSAAFSTSD